MASETSKSSKSSKSSCNKKQQRQCTAEGKLCHPDTAACTDSITQTRFGRCPADKMQACTSKQRVCNPYTGRCVKPYTPTGLLANKLQRVNASSMNQNAANTLRDQEVSLIQSLMAEKQALTTKLQKQKANTDRNHHELLRMFEEQFEQAVSNRMKNIDTQRTSQISSLQNQVTSVGQERNRYKSQLSSFQGQISSLQNQVTSAQANRNAVRASSKAEIDELKRQAAVYEERLRGQVNGQRANGQRPNGQVKRRQNGQVNERRVRPTLALLTSLSDMNPFKSPPNLPRRSTRARR